MTFLLKYRKPGGFLQLLLLVESLPPVKRHELFQLIAKEDPGWAYLLKLKSLTLEKVFEWKPDHLTRLWPHIPLSHAIAVWCLAPEPLKGVIEKTIPKSHRSSFHQTTKSGALPTPEELSVMEGQFLGLVRQLDFDGLFPLKDVDPSLVIDQKWLEKQDPFLRAS